jgi:hypothetical protein
MKRIALIAASSVAALAATFAIAQPQPLPPAGGGSDTGRQDRSETREQRRNEWRERRAEQMQTRMTERLAKVREDMKLKPEQVPLFDKVEGLIKQRAQQRQERWASLREQRETLRHADLMERLDAMSARQGERAARSKEMADAVRPLWATLSDEQKTVARRAVREAMAQGRERFRAMRERWDERRGGDHDRRGDDERGGSRRWHDRGGDWDRRG